MNAQYITTNPLIFAKSPPTATRPLHPRGLEDEEGPPSHRASGVELPSQVPSVISSLNEPKHKGMISGRYSNAYYPWNFAR